MERGFELTLPAAVGDSRRAWAWPGSSALLPQRRLSTAAASGSAAPAPPPAPRPRTANPAPRRRLQPLHLLRPIAALLHPAAVADGGGLTGEQSGRYPRETITGCETYSSSGCR